MFKSGYISIIGKPNVGKSTLLNKLLGEKIAITSKKPQTTRTNICGILTGKDYQLIFFDTPGIHKANKTLNKVMTSKIQRAIKDSDAVVFVTDEKGTIDEEVLAYFKMMKDIPSILVINKIELFQDEKEIKETEEKFLSYFPFKYVQKTSLIKNEGITELLSKIIEIVPSGPQYYPPEQITTETERFIISELIREKLIEKLKHEIPYSIAVQIEDIKYRQERDVYYIKAVIFVEKESQKMIVIGENGKMLKEIGTMARKSIEAFLNCRVFLELWVKIKHKWTKKEEWIKKLIHQRF
ncbi:MAG: GTPase Era [Deltaproteobacteria bacterium]|nr:GTPase Era [Deltaproteobacteria bacterium]